MKRMICTWLALLIGIFSLSASSAVERLLPAQPTPASGTVLVEDDFSVSPNGWGTMDNASGEINFGYGGIILKVDIPNAMVRTVNGFKAKDTTIDVDAVLMEGPANDNFGVICRYVDNDNFYAFVISHDGYYGLFKMVDGAIVTSNNESMLEYSDVIRKGGVVNHITATCQQDVLSLIVNDTLLVKVEDSSFDEGQIGLLASAYSEPGVRVLFDNLKVSQP